MKAVNLKCEFLTNPLGIDIKNPRITWNDEGDKNQSAYIVSFKVNDGDLIETDEMRSSSMNYIFDYPFKSRDRVEYFVTLIDENGEKGEESEHAYFEFGLLDNKEFEAHFIKGNRVHRRWRRKQRKNVQK